MIHSKSSSPIRTPQRKKRSTNSGRSSVGSAKTRQQDVQTPPAEPVPIHYFDTYKQAKAQAEMGAMFKKKKTYPIAPDALIPNSSCRTIFKRKEIKSVVIKTFQLRLDILANLQNQDNRNFNWQNDDDDWTEMDDPDSPSKPTNEKKSKETLVSRTKDAMPDLFKRLQNESWWKQAKEDKPNIRSILLYLNEILKLKQIDSYESACFYAVEIFRTYGIEPVSVNQILDILLDHLTKNSHDRLDIFTVRTIAQFMIERKDIIIRLLEYTLKCQPNDNFRFETVNAIKFITDVNHSEGIELVLGHMPMVYGASDENFSLKMIIKELESTKKIVTSEVTKEEESNEIHPLLKKISEERWFPRDNSSITLNYVLEAILLKLSDTTKTLIKTLTTHLIQLQRVIGYSKEQFDRVANAFISLLSHTDADYRLIAATNLANLNQETKAIDLALLNSFINDSRVLVRTECCDSLKKLTRITSETILKDCADEISYLETLLEDNFSLQNYLKEKNRLPTPPSTIIEEQDEIEEVIIPDQVEINEDVVPIIRSPSPKIIEKPTVIDRFPLPVQADSREFNKTPSVSSTMTLNQPSIRVEINGITNPVPPTTPKFRMERSLTRLNKSLTSPSKTPFLEQTNQKRSLLLPNNTNMWDSYVKQNEIHDQKQGTESPLSYLSVPPPSTVIDQDLTSDPIQFIIDEHKQIVGFYRMISLRPVLVPHKISMENVLAEQSHVILDQFPPSLPRYIMNLSDFNHNQYQLNEVEFTQLLSSLVIRAIEIHKQYEKSSPGMHSPSLTNAFSISQAHLLSSSSKFPSLASQRPTTRQFARMQSNIQAKATRDGINIHKAQHMEGVLSNLLKSNREQTKSTMISLSTSSSKQNDTTHAGLLVQILKSQGVVNPESYLQKIVQTYPKFAPILSTKIPQNLVSVIWNDPVTKQIASIFSSNKQERSSITNSSMKRSDTKPSDDGCTTDSGFDYSAIINRVDNKKKFLPTIQGSKMNLPRHVLKFGFREFEMDTSETSNNLSFDETRSKSRKRRVYMHMMFDQHDAMKNQFQQTIPSDYQTTSFVPIVARPPLCH